METFGVIVAKPNPPTNSIAAMIVFLSHSNLFRQSETCHCHHGTCRCQSGRMQDPCYAKLKQRNMQHTDEMQFHGEASNQCNGWEVKCQNMPLTKAMTVSFHQLNPVFHGKSNKKVDREALLYNRHDCFHLHSLHASSKKVGQGSTTFRAQAAGLQKYKN